MSKSEGLDYDSTVEALKEFYPQSEEEMVDDETDLPSSVPEAIRSIIHTTVAVESLGSMIWSVRSSSLLQAKSF